MFYTYILKSLKTSKFYFGHSENLSERLKLHNKGKVKFTKPFNLGAFIILKNLHLSRSLPKKNIVQI
uniref:GIY-YIG nuclease family protein n=1 Tax=Ignavibacterium album TaxID=591197 RepID=A0A7V2ZM66_9BACT